MNKQLSRIEHRKVIKELEKYIWSKLPKDGDRCTMCGKKLSRRKMFLQWKKYYRFLCDNCEILEQLKEKYPYTYHN